MEFKTSQGGETTLVFDLDEENVLRNLCASNHLHYDEIAGKIAKLRQANPILDFNALVRIGFPPTAGVVPPKAKKQPVIDPLVDLENLIRRRISAQQLPTGGTSNSQQIEAMLLQALATCLLGQTMRRDDG
jgi:hypothetical protein